MDDMLAERHAGKPGLRLVVAQADLGPIEQRQPLGGTFAVERAHGPQSFAPVEAQRTEGVGFGQPLDLIDVEP